MDASLTKAVRQGQNFVICSGDDGVYLPLSARANAPYYDTLAGRPDLRQVGWPASHRYAIAVGATELLTQGGNPGSYASERVWNAGVGRQLSQGGVSKIAYAPQWQRTLLPGQTASGYRAVPDVSFNGSFYSSAQIRGTDAQGNEAAWYVWGPVPPPRPSPAISPGCCSRIPIWASSRRRSISTRASATMRSAPMTSWSAVMACIAMDTTRATVGTSRRAGAA